MSWLTIGLCCVVLFLVVLLLCQPSKKGLPPGPKGWPLVGNLFNLLTENSTEYFSRISQQYGPLLSMQLGLQRVVVINSQEWLHQAFVKQGDNFNHRAHNTVIYFITNGRGIAMAEGQKWKDARRITVQVLRDFGMGKNSIENYVNLEVQALLETMQTKVNKPYEMHYDISTAVLNIVWHMLVGEQFKMGDPTLHWIVDSLEQSLNLVEQGGFLNFTPLLQFFGTFLRPRAFKVLFSMIHRMRYFNKLIKKHNERIDDPSKCHDLIYAFLEEQRKLKKNGEPHGTFTKTWIYPWLLDWSNTYLSPSSKYTIDMSSLYGTSYLYMDNNKDSQLSWLLSDLFIVGLDTTVTTLRWGILFFVTRPEIAKKLQAEIDNVVGPERRPCLTDRDRMPYMEAFINEVLRFSTITPLVAHATPEETTLGDYRIPKNTLVIGNLWGIHHDPKLWGDPHNFRPERFLDEEGRVVKSDNMVAFSLGRRNCLGESLARTEIFLFLSSMLQQFNFEACGEPPSEKFQHGILMHPVHHDVIIRSRCEQQECNTTSMDFHTAI